MYVYSYTSPRAKIPKQTNNAKMCLEKRHWTMSLATPVDMMSAPVIGKYSMAVLSGAKEKPSIHFVHWDQ